MKQETKKVKRDLVDFSVKRNTENGLTLKIKSPMFANFFKDNPTHQTTTMIKVNQSDETSIREYAILHSLANVPRGSSYWTNFDEFDTSLTNSSGIVNLSFLRVKGLENGVEIKINGRYSVEAMNFFKQEFKTAVQGFYMESMRAVNINCKVSVIDEVLV